MLALLLLVVALPTVAQTPEADRFEAQRRALVAEGRYRDAIEPTTRLLEIQVSELERSDRKILDTLNELATLHTFVGDHKSALPYAKHALLFCDEVYGEEHLFTAIAASNLASVCQNLKLYKESLGLNYSALKILEKTQGPENQYVAGIFRSLATLLLSLGEYEQALTMAEDAVSMRRKHTKAEHDDVAVSLQTLGRVHTRIGNYDKAILAYNKALELRQELFGKEHPKTVAILDDLGELYRLLNDYERSLPIFEKAVDISKNSAGANSLVTASSLNALADVHLQMGNPEKARPLYESAAALYKDILGPDHPMTAGNLHDFAVLHHTVGDYEKALEMNYRVLEILKDEHGAEHPDIASSLIAISNVYRSMEKFEMALPPLKEALVLYDDALGPRHPYTSFAWKRLAFLYLDLGEREESLKALDRASLGELSRTSRVFNFAPERQRLAYHLRLHPHCLYATLGEPNGLLRQLFRYKGLVLDSIAEDRSLAEKSRDPAMKELVEQARAMKQQLNQLRLQNASESNPGVVEQREAKENEILENLEAIQSELALEGGWQRDSRRALATTVAQVRAALPARATLVEFVRYDHYLSTTKSEFRYGAVVLPKRGEPAWIPLDKTAEEIDSLVSQCRNALRGGGRFALADSTARKPDSAPKLLNHLYKAVWEPVQRSLPSDTEIVIVSPDGELSFVSFATLLTEEEQFLAEFYTFTYVASGRDLLATEALSNSGAAVLIGDPDYNLMVEHPESGKQSAKNVGARDWSAVRLEELPFTRTECEGLQKFFKDKGRKVVTLLGTEADERHLRELAPPDTLHVATHGYFLPDAEENEKLREQAHRSEEVSNSATPTDPMYRSGLALSGAQRTLDLRKKGASPDSRNDGLLTAAEVSTLNLQGTRLVTLSACDTGSGKSRAGEGVLGLRRGFIQAGARNLLLTLWPVADRETSQLMQDFYARSGEKPAPLALAEVQREWLVRLRKERSVGEAAQLAGPFVLSFQGGF